MSTHEASHLAATPNDPLEKPVIDGGEPSPLPSEYIVLSRDRGAVCLSEGLACHLDRLACGRWALVKVIQQHNLMMSAQRQDAADIVAYLETAMASSKDDPARGFDSEEAPANAFAKALNERFDQRFKGG